MQELAALAAAYAQRFHHTPSRLLPLGVTSTLFDYAKLHEDIARAHASGERPLSPPRPIRRSRTSCGKRMPPVRHVSGWQR